LAREILIYRRKSNSDQFQSFKLAYIPYVYISHAQNSDKEYGQNEKDLLLARGEFQKEISSGEVV
jgi:hypothetical protein